MERRFSLRITGYVLVVLCGAAVMAGCGGKRKNYLNQVTLLVEQNDSVDARVERLPKVNAFKDPDYLSKLDGCIATKQTILRELEALKPPFLLATLHAKLIQAMKNGIRYLQSEREKFLIASQKMAKNPPPPDESPEMEIIREYQSQSAAYQADMREQLMKQQYEKLYYEAIDELERAKKF
jgi:hypothetical protein